MTEDIRIIEVDSSELQIMDQVGAGCTATVYRGCWNGMEVAIKQIDWNKSEMGVKEQRAFDREVEIMPRISHENLVKFMGVSSMARPFRIITEFCAGGCAFELLHNCDHIDLQWWQQLQICQHVARAMDYLHKFHPPIIHRDLKSLNLLLARPVRSGTDDPIIKVSDFGLSRMKDQAGPDDVWGKMTIAAGTCHWMAPEVLGGEYDEKADVYSFAMIIFEVVCREIPFEDHEPAMVGRASALGERPDLEAIPPDCPRELSGLMIACWAHDPRRRPAFDTIVPILDAVKVPPPMS